VVFAKFRVLRGLLTETVFLFSRPSPHTVNVLFFHIGRSVAESLVSQPQTQKWLGRVRVDLTFQIHHERKISSRMQRKDVGKYSFVNRTIQHWNHLPAEVLGILPCKPITFRKRVRKVIIQLN